MRGVKPKEMVQAADALSAIPAPRWLSKDSKLEWRRVMPILAERRILTDADLGSLENYCVAIGQGREMERHLQKHGQVIEVWKTAPNGDLRSASMSATRRWASKPTQ